MATKMISTGAEGHCGDDHPALFVAFVVVWVCSCSSSSRDSSSLISPVILVMKGEHAVTTLPVILVTCSPNE